MVFLPQNWLRARLVVIRVVIKTELASLHEIVTSIPEGRLLLKQQWTVSLKGCIHRGDARCLQRARRWWQEGHLTSCSVTLIIICHVEHVHATAEGATAAWVGSAGLCLVAPAQVVMAI